MDRSKGSASGPAAPMSKSRKTFLGCMPFHVPSYKGKKLRKRQIIPTARNASSISIAATVPRPSFSPTIRLSHGNWGNLSQNALNRSPSAIKHLARADRVELIWDRGTEPEIWGGFKDDEDMWMGDGTCLVFFEETNMRSPPTPYFRLDATVVTDSGLPFLVALLNAAKLPPSKKASHRYLAAPKLSANARKSLGYLPLVKSFSPLKFPEIDRKARRRDSERSLGAGERQTWTGNDNRWSAFLNNAQAHLNFDAEAAEVTHELWFVLPDELGTDDEHRRKLAIRNVLSILHGGSIVGHDFTRTLSDILEILVTFSKTAKGDTTKAAVILIIDYVQSKQLDDVRDDLQHALCLLAWSEKSSVQWEVGYLESFVHAAGMMGPDTIESAEFKRLSHITRTNLQNSYSGLQIVVKEVEKKLQEFDFSEMWTLPKATSSPAKKAYDTFREFLIDFYTDVYGQWPPKPDEGERWLDREVVQRLQSDFGALYDFLVDSDVYWETLKAAYRRDWEIVCTDTARDFSADLKGVNVTDILVGFDNHHGLHHIPLPYPLLPDDDMVPAKPRASSIFNSLKKREMSIEEEKQKFSMLMAFTSATNLTRQSMFRADNELLTAFQTHEQDVIPAVTLQEARLGRWILLYGILQFLSNLSVDVGGLRYTEDVSYLLCSSITGSPPWSKGHTAPAMKESTPLASYCWTALDRMEGNVHGSVHVLPRLGFLERPSSSIYPDGLGLAQPAASESKVDARSWMPGEDQITLYTQPNSQLRSSRAINDETAKSEASSDLPDALHSHPTHGRDFSPAPVRTTESRWTDVNSIQRPPQARNRAVSSTTATSQEAESSSQARRRNRRRDGRIRSTATGESEWTEGGFSATTRQSVTTLREADALPLPLQRGRLTNVNRRDFAVRDGAEGRMNGIGREEVEDAEESDDSIPLLSRG